MSLLDQGMISAANKWFNHNVRNSLVRSSGGYWLVQGKCVCKTIPSKILWWFLDVFIDRHKKCSKSYIKVFLQLILIENSSIKELKNIGLATVHKYSNYRIKKKGFWIRNRGMALFSPLLCPALPAWPWKWSMQNFLSCSQSSTSN